MNWIETAIVELGKLLRYVLRNTATTFRLCAILVSVTACLVALAWTKVL
jgi:hypothetical protein